jgi:hypothetical protein
MTSNRMRKYEGPENNIEVRYWSFTLRHSIVRLFVIRQSSFYVRVSSSLSTSTPEYPVNWLEPSRSALPVVLLFR